MSANTPTVGILLFDGVEPLDFAGPLEVLACSRDGGGRPLFKVALLAPAPGTVRCAGGLEVLVGKDLHEVKALDVFIVPGGPGARSMPVPAKLLEAVKRGAGCAGVVTSVCTGAFLLAAAGLLGGKRATTHSSRLEALSEAYPEVEVVREKIVADSGVVSAAGVSSGIDLGLYLIERFHGAEARGREAVRLDGPWK